MITTQRVAAGLDLLISRLGHELLTPEGWTEQEWAFIKGLASGAITAMQFDRLALAYQVKLQAIVNQLAAAAPPSTAMDYLTLDIACVDGAMEAIVSTDPWRIVHFLSARDHEGSTLTLSKGGTVISEDSEDVYRLLLTATETNRHGQ